MVLVVPIPANDIESYVSYVDNVVSSESSCIRNFLANYVNRGGVLDLGGKCLRKH